MRPPEKMQAFAECVSLRLMRHAARNNTGRYVSRLTSGTLAVNLVGCFLLGGIAQYGLTHLSIPPEWRIGITVGFFGAFTTFSTFSWEAVQLLQDGEWGRAATYVLTSVIGGLLAVVLGMRIAERI